MSPESLPAQDFHELAGPHVRLGVEPEFDVAVRAAAGRAIEAAAQRQTARTKPKALTDAIRLDSPPHAGHNPRHGSTVDQPADGLATTNRRAVGCADVLLAVVLVRAAQGGRPR